MKTSKEEEREKKEGGAEIYVNHAKSLNNP